MGKRSFASFEHATKGRLRKEIYNKGENRAVILLSFL